jgi:hypothetical protein
LYGQKTMSQISVQRISSFRLLKGSQDNIRNCRMNSRMNLMRIVKAAMSKNKHLAHQKEDVMNWIQDWINHGMDWMNPVWSVQSPDKIEPEVQVIYNVE